MSKYIELEKVKKLLVASNTPSLEKVVISDYLNAWAIEVSEDAISREWLLSNIEQGEKEYGGIIDTDTDNVKNFISVAPNVIPKVKDGECPYFIDGVWCNLVGKEMKGADNE